MPFASIMADEVKPEPGAPIPKDAIDPELIKLGRTKIRFGVITCAALVIACGYFALRLSPDRHFASAGDKPEAASAADIVAGKVALDRYLTLDAEPLFSHTIRAMSAKGRGGLRVAPIRGTGERLWLVTSGDGTQPGVPHYQGRLRKLADLPFADAVHAFATENPRPVFATPAAVRAGMASGKVATISGETVDVAPADVVAFDVVDPGAAGIFAAYTDKLADPAAWTAALGSAGITATPGATDDAGVHFTVTAPDAVAATTAKLAAANLFAATADVVTRHHETTWGALRASPAAAFAVDGATIPDAQIDLVGLYVARGIPSDAYALIDGENPDDYWYVLPVSIGLGVVGLLFAWALVRAVRRDLLSPR
jgi:hypothetical protein